MKDLILEIRWPGLGDHLLWTPIPRIAKQFGGYNRVYISAFSEFRSTEIMKFVWETNPFVDGLKLERGRFIEDFTEVEKDMNILDKMMLLSGVDDGERFHEPELYFRPVILKSLAEAIVYDPNYVANAGRLTSRDIRNFISDNRIQLTHQMKIRPKGNHIPFQENGRNNRKYKLYKIHTSTLEEFSSVIVSCKEMFCLTTGTATLAAALHKSVTVLYKGWVLGMAHHSQLHKYRCLP